jgi:hypothetical protein
MGPVPEQAMNLPKRPRISRGKDYQPSVGLRRQAASRSRKKQGERRPYLSAESCTHSAAGKSGSDSHRPKPSAMERDPVRPAAERTPNGQEGGRDEVRLRDSARGRGRGRGASSSVAALELLFGGEIRLVGVACCGSVALRPAPPFPLLGWCFTNSQVVFPVEAERDTFLFDAFHVRLN